MSRMFRPHFLVIGTIAVALIVWASVASASGARNAAHVTGDPRSLQAENSSASEPRAEPTAAPQVPEEENEAAEEQDEQAEDADEQNEQEDENQAPPSAPPAVTSETFTLVGGSVTFSCTGNVISLVSAVPNSGFSVETEREDGDTEVKVKFESSSHESEIRATCVSGQVQATEIEEKSS